MKLDAHASATVLPPLILARQAQLGKAAAPTTSGEEVSPPGEELPHLVATRQELTEVPPGTGDGGTMANAEWRAVDEAGRIACKSSVETCRNDFSGVNGTPPGVEVLPLKEGRRGTAGVRDGAEQDARRRRSWPPVPIAALLWKAVRRRKGFV